MQLQACVNPSPTPLPTALTRIVTPLNPVVWAQWLQSHPDQAYVSYLINGITQGFRIGFQYNSHKCIPAKSNHPSANDHPDIISKALEVELKKKAAFWVPYIIENFHTSTPAASVLFQKSIPTNGD